MKKIAVITFHHAHNFGSVLQTYALQETVKDLYREAGEEVEYSVIDLHTDVQERLYSVFKPGHSAKAMVKNLIALPYAAQLKEKHRKFEQFLQEQFRLTHRYRNSEELKENLPAADLYISGSDQIWNVRASDFSSAYYFDFLPAEAKRISYAASFGPLKIDWSQYNGDRIRALLERYTSISVREAGSARNIELLTGRDCSVDVDPTLLLTVEQWRRLQSDATYRGGQYILLYCLEPSKLQLEMADAASKKLGLPVVILRYNNKNDMFNHFVKKYDSGPRDFLAYIDHAALVLSSSFHGTAFSLIYHKPFYVFNGMKDNRISSILTKTGMTERSIEKLDDISRMCLKAPDGEVIEELLEVEREKSKTYLRRSLGIEKENSMD